MVVVVFILVTLIMVSAEVFRNTHLLMATMLLFTLMGRVRLVLSQAVARVPSEELERVCGHELD
jgi:hypothetical protein